MPRTVNGIGTKYFGASDRQPDGSFITTEWLTIFVPVIPLRSQHVRYLGKQQAGSTTSKLYDIVGPAKTDAKQVLTFYGLYLAQVVLGSLLFGLLGGSRAGGTICTILFAAVIVFWIWLVPDVYFKAE
jgi:hypothetical protein